MAYCNTEGIVLKITDYGETSQVVTAFTRDYGRLSGIAKGAKRLHKGVPRALDMLNRMELVFLRKPPGQLHVFTDWTVVENFLRLRQNLDTLYNGLLVAELLLDLTEESTESIELYALALDTLRLLGAGGDSFVVISHFEVKLLTLLGYMPEVTKCVVCGGALAAKARFSPREGGALCTACPAAENSCQEVSSGALASLATLARAETNLVRRLRMTPPIRKEIRAALNACIAELLGRQPRMARYLETDALVRLT